MSKWATDAFLKPQRGLLHWNDDPEGVYTPHNSQTKSNFDDPSVPSTVPCATSPDGLFPPYFKASCHSSAHVAPHMRSKSGGRLVNILDTCWPVALDTTYTSDRHRVMVRTFCSHACSFVRRWPFEKEQDATSFDCSGKGPKSVVKATSWVWRTCHGPSSCNC